MPRQDDEPKLSDREQARLQRRDRKRRTEMVVDNAGVKRVQRAIAQRRGRERAAPPRSEP